MTVSNQQLAPSDILLRCDSQGVICAQGIWQSRLEELRRRTSTHDSYWTDAARQVDAWPEQLGFRAELEADGSSLWALVRMEMVEQLANMLPELEIFDALVGPGTDTTLVLQDATPSARIVVRTIAANRGLAIQITDRVTPKISIRARLARVALLAARLLLGVARAISRPQRRSGAILSIDYTTLRRVRHGGRERMMNPYFTPVLDELERRGLPEHRINLPTLHNLRQDVRWFAEGDRHAIPFEWSYAKWRMGRRLQKNPQVDRALAKVLSAMGEREIRWHGLDIRPLAAEIVEEALRTRLPERLKLVDFFEHLFRRESPSVVLLTSEYSGAALAARFAALRLGIPAVGVQHGVIWRSHPGYVAPQPDLRRLARPDVLCVFGEFERDLIVRDGGFAAEQLVVTGAPRLDLFEDEGAGLSRGELAAYLKLPADAPLVLFTSTGAQGEVVATALVATIAASATPVSVIIKLHPTYPEERAIFEAAARRAGCAAVRVVAEEFDLFDLLRAADAHMSTNSTVLTEAVVVGKPNIMLCTATFVDTVDYLSREVAVSAEQYRSLADAVLAVTAGADAARLGAARGAFVRAQFHSLDRKASSRIADTVERIMRERDTIKARA